MRIGGVRKIHLEAGRSDLSIKDLTSSSYARQLKLIACGTRKVYRTRLELEAASAGRGMAGGSNTNTNQSADAK